MAGGGGTGEKFTLPLFLREEEKGRGGGRGRRDGERKPERQRRRPAARFLGLEPACISLRIYVPVGLYNSSRGPVISLTI